MSDRYDPDEKFSLWPHDHEDGLRRLLDPETVEDESVEDDEI